MTTELYVLALAGLLQILQFVLYSFFAQMQVGTQKALGPRDEPVVLTGIAGRLQRAMNNHFEGLILFGLAVVVVSLGEKSSAFTGLCAKTYLAARILYIPAYVSGAVPWRSVIWCVGFLASALMILAALF